MKTSWVKLRTVEGLKGFCRGAYWLSAGKGGVKMRPGLGLCFDREPVSGAAE